MNDQDLQALKPDLLTPAQIEEKTEQVGVTKATMSTGKSFTLAIMAGMYISMGAMFMLLIKSETAFPFVAQQLIGGLAFCLGLFLVLCAGAELFTGNVLMICAKLSKKIRWGQLIKGLVVVYLGNLVGSLIMVGILYVCNYGAVNEGLVGNAMIAVASSKIAQPVATLFVKGIMCNFLVCLAVWVAYAGRTLVDKFFAIILPISAFVACGFEHCVANMFFLPMGLVMKLTGFTYTGAADIDVINISGILYNLAPVTIGNIVGGMIMVGVVYWALYHKRDTAKA